MARVPAPYLQLALLLAPALLLFSSFTAATQVTDQPLTQLILKKTTAVNGGDISSTPAPAPAPAPAPSSSSSSSSSSSGAELTVSKMYSPSNGKGFYKGMSRQFIDGHNKVRARYGAPPLGWDKELALYARRWANANRKNCVPLHSGAKYAENIYLGRNGWNATANDAVYGWASEEPLYDKDTGECLDHRHFGVCGHFAIMVNKKYRWVGCGRAECYQGKGVFISCSYYATPPPTAPPKVD